MTKLNIIGFLQLSFKMNPVFYYFKKFFTGFSDEFILLLLNYKRSIIN